MKRGLYLRPKIALFKGIQIYFKEVTTVAYNPWSDIMQMSDTEFNQLRPIASSNDFFVVISGTDRGNRYTYRVAKRLRRHGIALAQDRVAEETRLVANAITARICQISQ